MRGERRALADAAHGQRGPLEVADTLEQGLLRGPVANGQVNIECQVLQSHHDALVVGQQRAVVETIGKRAGSLRDVRIRLEGHAGGERFVILASPLQLDDVRIGVLGFILGDDALRLANDASLLALREPRRRLGVEVHGGAGEEHDASDNGGPGEPPGGFRRRRVRSPSTDSGADAKVTRETSGVAVVYGQVFLSRLCSCF